MKAKILFDVFPFKKGDIISIPYVNENLQEKCGWQLWKVYKGELEDVEGIIVEEKKYKGSYWKASIYVNDTQEQDYKILELI